MEYKNKEWFIEKIKEHKTILMIAKATNYPITSLRRYAKKHEIESLLTKSNKVRKDNFEKYPYKNKQWLILKLKEYRNIITISKEEKLPTTSLYRYLKKFNLEELNNDKYGHRTYDINESYFQEIDNEFKAYFLGFIVADGCVCNDGNRFATRIGIRNYDGYILKTLLEKCNSNHHVSIDKQGTMHSIRLWSKQMFLDLNRLGVSERKTGKEKMPNIEEKLMRHFIRGFFDGDGTIYTRANRKNISGIGFICANKNFALEVVKAINANCEFEMTVHHKKNKNVYEWKTESRSKCISFLEWIYKDSNVSLIRKYERSKKYFNINSPSLEIYKEEIIQNAGTSLEEYALQHNWKQ